MKNIFVFFYLIGTIPFLFVGCDSPAGTGGISDDIADSKKRGVFISEYISPINPCKINDSIQLTVKEAWIEKHWVQGRHKEDTHIPYDTSCQLCINLQEKELKGFTIDWMIGTNADKYMRNCGYYSIVGDLKGLPGDTIEYKVEQGNRLNNDDSEKVIIGKFVLVKRGN